MKSNTAWLEIIKQSKEFIIKLCLSCFYNNNKCFFFSVILSQRQNELTGMLVVIFKQNLWKLAIDSISNDFIETRN